MRPRSPSSIEEEIICAPIPPNGARSRHVVRLTGSVGWDRGWSPTPSRATRSRGGETVLIDNGRASGGFSHPPTRSQHGGRALTAGGGAQNRVRYSRPPPPGAALGSRGLNPTSQDARLAAGSFVWTGGVRKPAMARSQYGYRVASRVASSIGRAHTSVRSPPPVSLGTTSGSQDSRAGCPPLRQRATGGRRHPERSDPMGVEAAQGGRCRM